MIHTPPSSRWTRLLLGLALLAGACAQAPTSQPAPTPLPPTEPAPTIEPTAIPAPANPDIILATTTSTQDSGLLDVLLPAFQAETGYNVKTVAVGTGQALKMGEEGNADVLLVHAPASEVAFMDGGFGIDRRLVMHNDFVLVGPAADPAAIKGWAPWRRCRPSPLPAATFVSRGDNSGTHKKELDLWKKAEIDPAGQTWYLETGQGMGATLTIASEKAAYTLTDRATYLANQDNLELVILSEGDPTLLNVYHVIAVNLEKWPAVNADGAAAFADYLTSVDGQSLIASFGVEEYGQPLFIPDAGKAESELGL